MKDVCESSKEVDPSEEFEINGANDYLPSSRVEFLADFAVESEGFYVELALRPDLETVILRFSDLRVVFISRKLLPSPLKMRIRTNHRNQRVYLLQTTGG